MLKRRLISLTVAAAACAGLVLVTATPALADVVCNDDGTCYVVVDTPGGPGSPGGGGSGGGSGSVVCKDPNGDVIDCYQEGRGWYDPSSYCFYRKVDPQPPAGDERWQGKSPADGTLYHYTCPYSTSWFGRAGDTVRATPPPGYGGLPTPETLAAQAIQQLPIRGPQIRTAPDVNGAGLVGLPVWLWTDVNANTWGPISATASVPGLSVTATAKASRIEWRMGDGHAETCTNPGTPHRDGSGAGPSPTCGYDTGYRKSSLGQPGGRYTVTAVTSWDVTWAGGGRAGTLTVARQSTSTIKIDEMQVVTR
ncbi:hypothetical protein ACLQ24_00120 [Micromonospora sp. DT4]|uniref:hypothetical protein n=1 Tax=Micromonospora sp. DT4 TaxID=3393438 RepID=UPI003CF11FC7